jgi:MipA family protein
MNRILAALPLALIALPAHAQEQDDRPWRYRFALGPQVTPSYPGADTVRLSPLIDVDRARGDDPFPFEAADDSFGFPVVHAGGFEFGPSANLQGNRRRRKAGAAIDEVGTTVELGGYAQAWLGSAIRARGEVRQGVNGHKGLIGNLALDYVARDGDKWLVSIGPRVTLSDARYRRAYFEVTPVVAGRTGLATYHADGGAVHAIGASVTSSYQFSPRWGVYGYAKYDRLTGDGADSPITQVLGTRNALSGGVALSFTFGKGVR